MTQIMYLLVEAIALVHNYILKLNDMFEYNFSDKELHFLVIGLIGMCFILVIYPIFKLLAENNHIMTITWIYVTTLIVVITFAIEIGQKITKTGNMEFADILFGITGFFAMYGIFMVIVGIGKLAKFVIKKITEEEKKEENA